MIKRIKIKEKDSYGLYELSGKLSDIVLWLDQLCLQGWEKIDIETDYNYDPRIVVSRYREETDKEYDKRCKNILKKGEQSKKLKAAKAEAELKLYRQLKAKYETKTH